MLGDDIILRTKVFRYLLDHPEYSFEILKTPTFYYRRHNTNISRNHERQIRIVTEYLERYWPERTYPKILLLWVKNRLPFRESLSIFSLNAKTASLLKDPEIQDYLIKKVKRETSFLRFLFFKELQGNKRIVRILHFIKFSYTRKSIW